jgi:hypothetical protein
MLDYQRFNYFLGVKQYSLRQVVLVLLGFE